MIRPQNRMLELHIRSLRTNKEHPLAKSPVLKHKLAGGALRYSHIMSVCQDRIAILHAGVFEPEIWHEKFVVYNWKTGAALWCDSEFVSGDSCKLTNVS